VPIVTVKHMRSVRCAAALLTVQHFASASTGQVIRWSACVTRQSQVPSCW
jgi:hypothetical protein